MWAALAAVCLALALSGVGADYTGDGELRHRFADLCAPGTASLAPLRGIFPASPHMALSACWCFTNAVANNLPCAPMSQAHTTATTDGKVSVRPLDCPDEYFDWQEAFRDMCPHVAPAISE